MAQEVQRRCQHSHCVTWSHVFLTRELRGWTGLGSIGTQKVVLGRLLQQRFPTGMEDESMCRDDGEDVDDEDMDDESESSSSSMRESPRSTHHYSDRCHHPCSWAEQSESGNEEDGSLGGLPTSKDSEGEGESKTGCHQPRHPPCCVNRSPPASQWRQPQRFWQPQRQCPLWATSCLQIARMRLLSTLQRMN